jgi:outer membrane receptor protein involved in Fe transport
VRQHLGRLRDDLDGIQFGANATFIDSEVTLPDDEALLLANAQVPTTTRDATNAPAYLYNLFLTYETESLGTQVGLFYTVQGDTLIAAGGTEGNTVLFVPDIYQKAFGTLNFTLSHRLGEHWILSFQAKNLTDPDIETVYRSDAIGGDVTKSSYSSGREFSISLGVRL